MLSKEDEWKMEEEVKENRFLMHSFVSNFDRTNCLASTNKSFSMIQHEVFANSFYVEVDQDRRELIAEINS